MPTLLACILSALSEKCLRLLEKALFHQGRMRGAVILATEVQVADVGPIPQDTQHSGAAPCPAPSRELHGTC